MQSLRDKPAWKRILSERLGVISHGLEKKKKLTEDTAIT